MKPIRLIFILLLLPFADAAADIAPNPINAGGIIPAGTIDVRLVWERVVVDLYCDSSVVEATFYMRNEGKEQKINIGFPEMNFYQRGRTAEGVTGSFTVFENERQVKNIRLYKPVPAAGSGRSNEHSFIMSQGDLMGALPNSMASVSEHQSRTEAGVSRLKSRLPESRTEAGEAGRAHGRRP